MNGAWRPPVSVSRGIQQTVEVKQRKAPEPPRSPGPKGGTTTTRAPWHVILNIASNCRVFSSKTLTPEEAADPAFDLRALAKR
jgi:hypothetical protein